MRRSRSWKRGSERRRLFQLGILGLGFAEDGDVGVSIFPEVEKVLVGSASLCGVAGESVGARQPQMCQRAKMMGR
jgi:hypothetical protein